MNPDWTIADLLQWASDDRHQHDASLRDPLVLIESALTGSSWARQPSTVALTRSIAAAVRATPSLGLLSIGSLFRRADAA